MPLLRPPDPQIPKRKSYVGIEEPLALTLDRYVELLGTTGIHHFVNQALEFVFRKDGDCKEWLSQTAPRPTLSQSKKTRSVLNSTPAQHVADETEPEEARRL